MTHERQRFGADGERAAERLLRARGYTIIERNFRCARGEIDLIALHRRCVVFVEVKTRRGGDARAPFDAVDARKQRQIVRAAEFYLAARRLIDRDVRFDVVSVWHDGEQLRCELLENAFDGEEPGDTW
jgi:putative endonuclease